MALTRRQFLKRTGLAAAGSFLGPSLFRNPFLQRALADQIGDRYLVVVFLDGGNDGLHTVVPVSGTLRAAYQTKRFTGAGGLQLPASGQGSVVVPSNPFVDPASGSQLGFHPGLAGADGSGGLRALYDLGKVAVVQGCGYPDYNLSHDSSRRIWESANPLGIGPYSGGWMGRYLTANYGSLEIPAVSVRNEVAGEFQQTSTSVLAVRRLAAFGFPYDDFDGGDDGAKKTAFLELCHQATLSAQPTLAYLGASGRSAETATESYPALIDLYNARPGGWSQQYADLDSSFARDLREVARVINGVRQSAPNVHARFFEVANGGYDTHSDQGRGLPGDQHYDLHREVGDALALFYNDCVDMGVENKVCIVVWSEFGRRVEQNGNGTDHGSQGPMFVVGGAANGGVYGNHPAIADAALDDDGNTVYWQGGASPEGYTRSTDFRDVFGTILTKWLGMPEPQVLASVLPLDAGDPDIYWTANDFNLGFL